MMRDEEGVREEASRLRLHKVEPGQTWLGVSSTPATTLLELRLYNPYLAERPLRPGQLVAYPTDPASSPDEILQWYLETACWTYRTLPGDLYHHLAFAFDVPLDRMRMDN